MKENKPNDIKYTEPEDYIPKELMKIFEEEEDTKEKKKVSKSKTK